MGGGPFGRRQTAALKQVKTTAERIKTGQHNPKTAPRDSNCNICAQPRGPQAPLLSAVMHSLENTGILAASKPRIRKEVSGILFYLGRNEQLARDSQLEGFVKYLAVRMTEQRQGIANLVTAVSEPRTHRDER